MYLITIPTHPQQCAFRRIPTSSSSSSVPSCPLSPWLSHQTTLARGIPGNQVRPIGGGKWVPMVSPFSDGGADTQPRRPTMIAPHILLFEHRETDGLCTLLSLWGL